MDKQQLLAFIQSLPYDMEVQPIELSESSEEADPWVSRYLPGGYQRKVSRTLTLRLDYSFMQSARFLRTYENPDGSFYDFKDIGLPPTQSHA